MEISNARHQAMVGHGLEEIVACPKIQLQQPQPQQPPQEKKQIRPHPEQPLKCPRCASSNTKFCYYNNYSLSQPRYFCKGCRRYWTQGGSLRNVPVGGGCRKNKRPSSASNPSAAAAASSSSSASKRVAQDGQDLTMSCTPTGAPPSLLPTLSLPPLPYDPSDLTLAFSGAGQLPMKQFGGLEDDSSNLNLLLGSSSMPPALAPPSSQTSGGFLDILRSGFIDMANGAAAPTGFDAIYYGGGVNGEEEAFGGATTTTSCDKDNNGGDMKMQMGLNYPWQEIAAGGSILDSGRDCNNWNISGGVNGSSWQGLINSSLL